MTERYSWCRASAYWPPSNLAPRPLPSAQGSLYLVLLNALNISSLDCRVLAASQEPQAFLVSKVTEYVSWAESAGRKRLTKGEKSLGGGHESFSLASPEV